MADLRSLAVLSHHIDTILVVLDYISSQECDCVDACVESLVDEFQQLVLCTLDILRECKKSADEKMINDEFETMDYGYRELTVRSSLEGISRDLVRMRRSICTPGDNSHMNLAEEMKKHVIDLRTAIRSHQADHQGISRLLPAQTTTKNALTDAMRSLNVTLPHLPNLPQRALFSSLALNLTNLFTELDRFYEKIYATEELNSKVAYLRQELEQRDSEIQSLRAAVTERDKYIKRILSSEEEIVSARMFKEYSRKEFTSQATNTDPLPVISKRPSIIRSRQTSASTVLSEDLFQIEHVSLKGDHSFEVMLKRMNESSSLIKRVQRKSRSEVKEVGNLSRTFRTNSVTLREDNTDLVPVWNAAVIIQSNLFDFL